MSIKPSVFVAGRWSDRERIHSIINDLRGRGYPITHDWTQLEADESSNAELQHCCLLDLDGVSKADIFVFIADRDQQWRGAYAELGYAIAFDKPIYILGDYADKCIHTKHPLVHKIQSLQELP